MNSKMKLLPELLTNIYLYAVRIIKSVFKFINNAFNIIVCDTIARRISFTAYNNNNNNN